MAADHSQRGSLTHNVLATDAGSLNRHFGDVADLLPLWIAEPYIPLAPSVTAALQARSIANWYGYETRPDALVSAFWTWMMSRHGWDGSGLQTSVSPSVGTSMGVLVERYTAPGDGVILQPPVFTDFKPLVASANRVVVRNPLLLTDEGYRMDFDGLAAAAANPANRLMILCNPHNPVGRVWTIEELSTVASICSEHDVLVIADEIHADLVRPPHGFVPFAANSAGLWCLLGGDPWTHQDLRRGRCVRHPPGYR